MQMSDGATPMEEDAPESAPAGEHDLEPGEQPFPKKQKVSGGTDPSARQVATSWFSNE